MSGVRCVVWDEWCEMTSVWDGWCEMNGVRWRRWVAYDGGRWVVRAEWWEMSGGRWVVRDEWWEMSVYVTCCMRWMRWVVWDVCVCDMLCERWMRWVVWDGGGRWAMWDEWIKMSGVRWVVWERLPRTMFTHSKAPNPHARKTSTQKFRISYSQSYPERRLRTARRQTRMPGRHQRKIFAPPIGRATPTTFTHSKLIYAQQAAKPACQQHINAKFSHLLLAQLPRTEFTHSKAPSPLSTWPFLKALSIAPATQTGAAGQRRPGAPQPFLEALNIAPATQTGAAGQRRPGAPQPFLEALSIAPAAQTGAAGQRRPGAPQPFLEALNTAPATQTGAAGQRWWGAPQPFLEYCACRKDRSRWPEAATLSRGSEYCACHTDRSRGPAVTRRRNPF